MPTTEAGKRWMQTPAAQVVTGMAAAIDAIEAEARNTLDEQRLAWVLALFPEDIYAHPGQMAAAIAKAYREDAG